VRAALVSAIGLLLALAAGFAVRGLAASRPLSPAFLRSHSNCAGHELWKIKTLVDDQAGEVNKTAKTTTVEALRANDTRPENVSSIPTRIRPVEFRRFRVHATIDEAFREGDGDLHVVIHDRANDGTSAAANTMIAEFPDATCEPQKASTYADAMGKARDAFKALVKRCTGYQGNFGSHRHLSLHATITGVGFWDVEHGTPQKGRAPNDLELHPVLKFTQATCT